MNRLSLKAGFFVAPKKYFGSANEQMTPGQFWRRNESPTSNVQIIVQVLG
jgi:hypothetical protein